MRLSRAGLGHTKHLLECTNFLGVVYLRGAGNWASRRCPLRGQQVDQGKLLWRFLHPGEFSEVPRWQWMAVQPSRNGHQHFPGCVVPMEIFRCSGVTRHFQRSFDFLCRRPPEAGQAA